MSELLGSASGSSPVEIERQEPDISSCYFSRENKRVAGSAVHIPFVSGPGCQPLKAPGNLSLRRDLCGPDIACVPTPGREDDTISSGDPAGRLKKTNYGWDFPNRNKVIVARIPESVRQKRVA